jgi:hypothetical protein
MAADTITKFSIAAVLVFGLLSGSVAAKGLTTKVILRDTSSNKSVTITDAAVLKDFSVWSGPGTFSNGVEGTRGFIIDWPAGFARDRPDKLRRYEVEFFAAPFGNASDERLVYIVFYEIDPSTNRAFVYLPGNGDTQAGLNMRSILHGHGLEGHWFKPTDGWRNAVDHLLLDRPVNRLEMESCALKPPGSGN